MNTAVSRMQFLRGDFSGRRDPIRPPWAIAGSAFADVCERCDQCIDRCPTRILKRGRAGYPVVDFSAGECLLCGDCVAACKPGALRRGDCGPAWTLRAFLDAGACLGFRGVECRSCSDACAPRAIRMRPRPGAAAIPLFDISACNGCGGCFSVCPAQAIDMRHMNAQEGHQV